MLFSRRWSPSGTLCGVTIIKVPLVQERRPAESAVEERLWEALHSARSGHSPIPALDLEDALLRIYQPLARTIAQATVAESAADLAEAEETAQLGLTDAVRGWQNRTGGGFRYHAQTAILNGFKASTSNRSRPSLTQIRRAAGEDRHRVIDHERRPFVPQGPFDR